MLNHNPNLSLKPLANSCKGFGGAVTFYVMGFQTLAVDRYMEALQKEAPQFMYVNVKTGEETPREPAAYKAAADLAKFTKSEIVCDWTREQQWTIKEHVFVICDALTVDIEFHDTSRKVVRALEMYWQNRSGNVVENYNLFCQLVGTDALIEWDRAYTATRDTSMSADEMTQAEAPPKDADPQP